jgi:hypothetical protein
LWEAARQLRQEAEAEIESRRRQNKPTTDSPWELQQLIGGMEVLERSLRKAKDDITSYYRSDAGTFGDNWLRRHDPGQGGEASP